MRFSISLSALLFLVLAAACGVGLARSVARRRPPRAILVLLHGLLALSGILLIGGAYVRMGGPVLLLASLLALVAAASLGASALSLQARGKRVPLVLVLLHALLAAAGVALLVTQVVVHGSAPPQLGPGATEQP